MNSNEHKQPVLEVNPSIAAITSQEEIDALHKFLTSQEESNEETANSVLNLIDKAAETFGDDLVKETLYYLACSRRGLTINDLEALLGDSWDNEKFSQVAVCFGIPMVAAFENALVIPSVPLRSLLLSSLSEGERVSFHSDIAFRLMKHQPNSPLHITETMFHLLQCNKPGTAANFFAKANGPVLQASAGAVGSTFVAGGKSEESVVAMLDAVTESRFQFYRHFINEVFMAMTQHSAPENSEKLITLIEQRLLAVMGEKNTIDNILLLALTGLRIAMVNLRKQDMDKVKEYFDRSIGIVDRLMQMNPGAEAFSYENCDALFNMGMICMDMHQAKAAQHCFDIAFDILEAKVTKEPADSPRVLLLASWVVTVCRLCQQIQDKEAGEKYFNRGKGAMKSAIAAKANMAAKSPGIVMLERDLMIMYNDFGDLCHENGLKDEALNAYDNALVIGERLASAHPESNEMLVAPSITFDRLGKMYADLKDNQKAIEYFEKSLELRKSLSESHPADLHLKHDLAAAYHNLASMYGMMGEKEKVGDFLRGQYTMLKEVFNANPRVEANILPWLDSVLTLADYNFSLENFDVANEVLMSTLEDVKPLFGIQVSEAILTRIASIHYKAGMTLIKKEQFTPAHANIVASLELWKQLFEVTKNPGYQKNIEQAEEVMKGFSTKEESSEESKEESK